MSFRGNAGDVGVRVLFGLSRGAPRPLPLPFPLL